MAGTDLRQPLAESPESGGSLVSGGLDISGVRGVGPPGLAFRAKPRHQLGNVVVSAKGLDEAVASEVDQGIGESCAGLTHLLELHHVREGFLPAIFADEAIIDLATLPDELTVGHAGAFG